jgi:hypothetical protein
MTAPAIAPAPTAAPVVTETVAPVVETPVVETPVVETPKLNDVQGVIDKITRRPVADDALEELRTEEAAGPTDTVPPITEAPVVEAAPSMVAEIKSDEPEGEVVLRARDPKTGQFSDMDSTRTYELSIKDKQTGETKVYQKDLPGLMRLAKDGLAMQRSRGELDTLRTQVPQFQQNLQQLQETNKGLQDLAIELLSAPDDVVIARRQAYANENTPDKVFQRRSAELQQREAALAAEETRRQQTAHEQMIGQAVNVLGQRLGPTIAEAEGLVGKELAAGQLMLALAPLMVNGVIPPQHFQQVEQYVTGPYKEWVKAEAAKRTASQTQQTEELNAAKAERAKAQLNARNAGIATRPVGGNAGNANATPQTKPRNVDEAINRIIRRPVAAGG